MTRRAADQLQSLRETFRFVERDRTALAKEAPSRWRWWTFAGHRANGVLAEAARASGGSVMGLDDLSILLASEAAPSGLLRSLTVDESQAAWIREEVMDMLKFSELLPAELARSILAERFSDRASAQRVLREPVTTVTST